MKVGNLVGGLEVVDVKRVNKLNLIQFLKELDSYLQNGYRIDVNSARQVGLVLSVDLFKTEAPCSPRVGSTGVKVENTEPSVKEEVVKDLGEQEVLSSKKTEEVEVVQESLVDDKAPVTTKETKTTRASTRKKTT